MAETHEKAARRRTAGEHACRFRAGDSPIHRLPAGWKLGLTGLLCALAIPVRQPLPLLLITLLTLGCYFAARLTLRDLWTDVRFLLVQAAMIIGLSLAVKGWSGLWVGVRSSLQIMLFFLPAVILVRTTRAVDMMRGLRWLIPYRLSFILFVSFRFMPFFARELREIREAQQLRGARLSPRELLLPWHWGDLFSCLLVPLLVRALKTAEETALAAESREFGTGRKRTYYDANAANSSTAVAAQPASSHEFQSKKVVNA